jgi:hypothetical protein
VGLGVGPLRGGQLGEQREQGVAFVVGERGDEFGVVRSDGSSDLGEPIGCGACEVDLVVATVRGAAPALDQAALLELVEQLDDAARRSADSLSQLLLARPGVGGDQPEEAGVRWSQVEGGQALGKASRDVGAELGEEERDAGRGSRWHDSSFADRSPMQSFIV